MPGKVWDEITYPFLNFNGCTVEVLEWISDFISHLTEHVITYPCWDWSSTMLVKGAPGLILWAILCQVLAPVLTSQVYNLTAVMCSVLALVKLQQLVSKWGANSAHCSRHSLSASSGWGDIIGDDASAWSGIVHTSLKSGHTFGVEQLVL